MPYVIPVKGEASYIATYKIRTYKITWNLSGVSQTTYCEHGKTPTPPDGCNIGDSLVIGDSTYIITGWKPAIAVATSDTTYTASAVAIRSRTISARPTKVGATSDSSAKTYANQLIEGSSNQYGVFYATNATKTIAIFYGYNFDELKNKQNVQIKDIRIKATYRHYAGGTGIYNSSNQGGLRVVKDFNTSGTSTSTYTDLGDGLKTVKASVCDGVWFDTTFNLPNTRNNLSVTDLINGYTSNTLGVYAEVARGDFKDFVISVDYTYEEEV
jgi:hypothetical protein